MQIDSHRETRFGSISAAPSHGTRGCFAPKSCRTDRSLSRQLRAMSDIQLIPKPSERRSSHYEATGDYLNSRYVYFKEEPKPATYGAP